MIPRDLKTPITTPQISKLGSNRYLLPQITLTWSNCKCVPASWHLKTIPPKCQMQMLLLRYSDCSRCLCLSPPSILSITHFRPHEPPPPSLRGSHALPVFPTGTYHSGVFHHLQLGSTRLTVFHKAAAAQRAHCAAHNKLFKIWGAVPHTSHSVRFCGGKKKKHTQNTGILSSPAPT